MCSLTEGEYLDTETLKFWMELYFKPPIHNIISVMEYIEEMTYKESEDKCNKEFIEIAYKITNIMNDKLYNYYNPLTPLPTASEKILEFMDSGKDFLLDDTDSLLPENPTVIDILNHHFNYAGRFYDYYQFRDIFEDFNTNFIGIASQNSKIITRTFDIEFYAFPDAIDIMIKPSDIEHTKQAIIEYMNLFKSDSLTNFKGNVRSYKASIQKFYTYLKESEYILSDFYYKEDEHLHAIFSLAMDDRIKINAIDADGISINVEDFVNNYEEFKTGKIINNRNKTTKKPKKLPTIDKEKSHMQPKQWKLLFCLLKVAMEFIKNKQKIGEISKEFLIKNMVMADSIGAQDTAKTRFNDKYNKIMGNKKGEYEDLIYPKVSDAKYYEFDVIKVINFGTILRKETCLSSEYEKHKFFMDQIVDYDLPK